MENHNRWLVLTRDLISIVIGAGGLIHSQLTGMVSPVLVPVYLFLLGYPGVFQLLELRSKKDKDSSNGGS